MNDVVALILGGGRGTRLFPEGAGSVMSLVECSQLGGGIVLLRYKA